MKIFNKILELREDKSTLILKETKNRYGVLACERDGSTTAYYFTAPIYRNDGKTAEVSFSYKNGAAVMQGSGAKLSARGCIVEMENGEGVCRLTLPYGIDNVSEEVLSCGTDKILPTTNGILYVGKLKNGESLEFVMEAPKRFFNVRSNEKCVALMAERFKPYVSVSAIGTVNESGKVVAPAVIKWKSISGGKYLISISSALDNGEFVMFECNLYAPKLFQDTTVESNNPSVNNAFGSSAFIGRTELFGEQWLYMRPAEKIFKDLKDKSIKSVAVHFPVLGRCEVPIDVFGIERRFCSFGSNWENKVRPREMVCRSERKGNYISVDITKMLTENGKLKATQGFILKSAEKSDGFTVIPTADNYFSLPVFEINFTDD